MFCKIESDVKHIYGYRYIQIHMYTYTHIYDICSGFISIGPSFFLFLKTGTYIT